MTIPNTETLIPEIWLVSRKQEFSIDFGSLLVAVVNCSSGNACHASALGIDIFWEEYLGKYLNKTDLLLKPPMRFR